MPTEAPESGAGSALGAARALCTRLGAWLRDAALPLWSQQGYERARGGFEERLTATGAVSTDARRARVQLRQVYVFANAATLGWRGDPLPLVRDGLAHFLQHYRRRDGLFRTLCARDGTPLDERALLYDQAFVLLALAESQRVLGRAPALIGEAEGLLAVIRRLLKRAGPGFDSGLPARLPLLANPHMHLLEAALAWRELGSSAAWRELVDEVVALALARLIDAESGALTERFTADWQPLPGLEGRLVEPGHLFEWAWLLQRCGDAAAHTAAVRLIGIAEQHGVRKGVAINALLSDFSVHDAEARLWPQTERLKANARLAITRPQCWRSVVEAGETLLRYLAPVPGLWYDRLTVAGTFVCEPAPASTLYHIVAACLELQSALTTAATPLNPPR